MSPAFRIAFLPLTDAAVLIAAARLGFAAREGIDIDLRREASWASVRDRLAIGHVEGAHLLAPLAIAATLGIGHVKTPLAVPFALNLDGNAITVSPAIWAEMQAAGAPELSPIEALGRVVASRAEPITLASVHPFSTHHYQLRLLLEAAALDPDRDARLVVLPPPYMVDALRQGLVDGFCVGNPWNSLAVAEGSGHIIALGRDICPRAPEKILGLTQTGLRDTGAVIGLIKALKAAADWCAAPENLGDLAILLAQPDHVGLPAELIEATLRGNIIIDPDGSERHEPDFLLLSGAEVNRPQAIHADWLLAQMIDAGQIELSSTVQAAARGMYRPDLYDAAVV